MASAEPWDEWYDNPADRGWCWMCEAIEEDTNKHGLCRGCSHGCEVRIALYRSNTQVGTTSICVVCGNGAEGRVGPCLDNACLRVNVLAEYYARLKRHREAGQTLQAGRMNSIHVLREQVDTREGFYRRLAENNGYL